MTNQEAVRILDEQRNKFMDEWVDFGGVNEAYNIAIQALKKQEPVKPVNVRWEMGINGGNCPKCMNWVQRSYNYCPFCGKAVKWE